MCLSVKGELIAIGLDSNLILCICVLDRKGSLGLGQVVVVKLCAFLGCYLEAVAAYTYSPLSACEAVVCSVAASPALLYRERCISVYKGAAVVILLKVSGCKRKIDLGDL